MVRTMLEGPPLPSWFVDTIKTSALRHDARHLAMSVDCLLVRPRPSLNGLSETLFKSFDLTLTLLDKA